MARTVDLGFRPTSYQMRVHAERTRFSTLVCHRRFGKTEFAVQELIDNSISNPRKWTWRNAKQYAYIAPKANQAKRVAWAKFKDVARLVPGAEIKERELMCVYPWGAIVYLIGADYNADSMRGQWFDGVIVDEMGDISIDIWDTIIRPTLADYKGFATFIGTPKGPNGFYDMYRRGLSGEAGWSSFMFKESDTAGALDMPWLDAGEREAMARDMGGRQSKKWRREMECDFEVAADESLIAMQLASDAMRRLVKPEDVQTHPVVVGFDVARDGGDPSVLAIRQGRLVHAIEELRIPDNMVLADAVARRLQHWNADACFLDMGGGQGVHDRLRQLGFNQVQGVFFGGGATASQRYQNRRIEMWDLLRIELDAGLALPPGISGLAEELAAPTVWRTGSDKLQMEAKSEIRTRLGKSTDRGDALALTFASPVRKSGSTGAAGRSFARMDYNVLDM